MSDDVIKKNTGCTWERWVRSLDHHQADQMTHREIARKVSSIVEFSEIEDFVNLPVKKYSSGMFLRLAFSIAVHLDADIVLLIAFYGLAAAAYISLERRARQQAPAVARS